MPQFRVILHGTNFRLRFDDGDEADGFWTTRWVDAPDAREAELRAVQMIRDDPRFEGIVLNEPDDPPRILVDDLVPMEPGEERADPGSGYTFYGVAASAPDAYGPLRPGRCLVAALLSAGAYLVWNHWILWLAGPWFLGVVFRLWDLRVVGLARIDRSWLMNARTWVFDFALRGYFRAAPHQPVVH